MNLNDIKEIINKNNFKFKKKFGQNFIIDENIIKKIIDKSEIDKDTLVIEIGPGAGSLTTKLATVAGQVLCYEIDITLEPILNQNFSSYSNVRVIYEDFLKANVLSDISKYNFDKVYVVSNLPYYITTPIIFKFIEEKIPVTKIIIMIQKEVGNRFKAQPNTKDYGSLSVFLNYYFNVRKIMDVSRNVFIPKPNVDSIVVEMCKRDDKIYVKDENLFFKIIKDSFRQKRKTLRNNLLNYNLANIENTLLKNDFSLESRAEQIPIEVFAEIVNNYTE